MNARDDEANMVESENEKIFSIFKFKVPSFGFEPLYSVDFLTNSDFAGCEGMLEYLEQWSIILIRDQPLPVLILFPYIIEKSRVKENKIEYKGQNNRTERKITPYKRKRKEETKKWKENKEKTKQYGIKLIINKGKKDNRQNRKKTG